VKTITAKLPEVFEIATTIPVERRVAATETPKKLMLGITRARESPQEASENPSENGVRRKTSRRAMIVTTAIKRATPNEL